jgi:hypothetical protein
MRVYKKVESLKGKIPESHLNNRISSKMFCYSIPLQACPILDRGTGSSAIGNA